MLGHAEITNMFEDLYVYATQKTDNEDIAHMLMDFYFSCKNEYFMKGKHSILAIVIMKKYWDRLCKQ